MNKSLHIKVPRIAKQGEVIRLMTKLNHPMESGWRRGQDGKLVAKDLVGEFVCLLDEREVFRAELDSGAAGNPYLSFYVRVEKSGTFHFVWSGSGGEHYRRAAAIEVI